VKDFFDQIRPFSFLILVFALRYPPIMAHTVGPAEDWAMDQAMFVFMKGVMLVNPTFGHG